MLDAIVTTAIVKAASKKKHKRSRKKHRQDIREISQQPRFAQDALRCRCQPGGATRGVDPAQIAALLEALKNAGQAPPSMCKPQPLPMPVYPGIEPRPTPLDPGCGPIPIQPAQPRPVLPMGPGQGPMPLPLQPAPCPLPLLPQEPRPLPLPVRPADPMPRPPPLEPCVPARPQLVNPRDLWFDGPVFNAVTR